MTNTLDLDDEWGPVDIVIALETAFALKFEDEEVRPITTVGQMYDLLLHKIALPQAGRKCATAMAFYRLRRALTDLRCGELLSPESELSFLEQGRTKRNWQALEKALDLKLPALAAAFKGPLFLALIVAAAAVPAALIGFVLAVLSVPAGEPLLHSAPVLLFAGIVLVILSAIIDPGKLPQGAATLGALAQSVAEKNYGQFVKDGAKIDEAMIWRVMLSVFAEHSSLPSAEVARDTTFLRQKHKKAA